MSILKLYAPFFDGNNWLHVLTSGKDWMIILTLIIMECLLSVDNAVVLAAQTQVLPTKSEKEKSLIYGLWGAYLFRFIVIGIGTYLINFWEIKLAGSIYLFYLSFKFFYDQRHPKQAAEHEKEKEEREEARHKGKKKKKKHVLSLFWRTVPLLSTRWTILPACLESMDSSCFQNGRAGISNQAGHTIPCETDLASLLSGSDPRWRITVLRLRCPTVIFPHSS